MMVFCDGPTLGREASKDEEAEVQEDEGTEQGNEVCVLRVTGAR